jgi:TonB family protein
MSIRLKLAISIALFCVSSMGRARSPASQQSAGTVSTPKPGEYQLDPIETSKATYPPAAKEQKIQGQVVGMILVSEIGTVESVHFFKGDPVLAAAAEEAARKWKFKPVMKNDQPMAVVARTTFNFVLPNDVQEPKEVAAELDQITRFPLRVRVSSGVIQRMILKKVDPVYPETARSKGTQGTVLLQAIVSKEGKIADLRVMDGPEALVPAALDAVRQWQYKPYLMLGRPLEVDTEIQVNFTLRER